MESTPEQVAEGLVVVRVLGRVLEKLVAANVSHTEVDQGQITKFHALKAPSIGISQYLERIHKYASCSTECFILALIYIDRLIQGNNFLLTELNVHRVTITSILLAAKFFDDAYYNNAYYAKVGGVLVSEMNRLEVEFLFRINFSLHVSPELYNKYHAQLSQHVVCQHPLSSPAIFVQTAEIAKPEPQVNLISNNCVENNASVLPTHSQHSAVNSNHTLPEAQQYIAGFPLQITPSPPAPTIQDVEVLPANSGNAYSAVNVSAYQYNPYQYEEDFHEGKMNESPIKVHPIVAHPTVHCNNPIFLQPKLRNPWAQRPDTIHCSRDSTSTSYRVSTETNPKESSFYVEYTNYDDRSSRPLSASQSNMIDHDDIMRYQPRSVPATLGAAGYHSQGW